MANVKISALPAATTPLAGTEVLPIVQSGITKQVSIANLTLGRPITASSITDSALTSGRVTYAGTAGLLQDSANLTFDGTTLTTSTLNLTNALGIAYGGTGQITANASFNALAPSQTGNSGKYLTTDGSNTSWATNPLGTVTSITAGTGLTGGTITTSGTIAIDTTVVATLTGTQTLTNKTISGATNTLSNIGNASLTNSAITINGTSTSLGGSISVGTVTSVTGTSPVVSSGGATPAISMPVATTSVSGYLSSTDWTTFNNKSNTNGTVTSVAALTLGTSGTDLSSTVATGTTTPVITLNVPTASATNRGVLSSADWTTFNNKQPAGTYVTSVTGTAPVVSSGGTTPAISMAAATTSVNGYLTSTDWTTFNGKQAALVSGTNLKTVNGTTLLGSGDLGIITGTYGGTGINNGSNTITTAGNLTFAGAFTQSFTATANTAVTLPAGATAASNNLLSSATAVGIITGTPTSSTYLRGDGTWAGIGGGGTVTSVAATVPAFLSIAGSPITSSGTLAISYSGTALPIANGGTAVTTTPTNGQLLIGNGTNYTLSTLTAGTNMSVTNTAGTITLATNIGVPQVTTYASGSGTYTTPTGAKYLIVEMIGGGGGGSGGGTGSFSAGGTGGTTTFGSNTCIGGGAGPAPWTGVGGNGGTITQGTGTKLVAIAGGYGGGSGFISAGQSSVTQICGGNGGNGAFGGGAAGASYVSGSSTGSGNTGGGGGGGASGNDAAQVYTGCGGGAGGYIKALVTSPSATYSYAVGAGGTAGSAGTGNNATPGGAGGSGYIAVTAFF
jgi:hypothetical protein